MAQKTGQEETEFKSVPEILPLCANNDCRLSTTTSNNICQTCVKFTDRQHASAEAATTTTTPPPDDLVVVTAKKRRLEEAAVDVEVKRRVVNRCSGCRRKVGLTGFRCRCGELFCSEHRYSDRHDCGYDYKAAGREAIAKENPEVRAAKLVKV